LVRESELRVCDEQFLFSTEAKEEEAIIIAVSHALLADYEFMFSPHSGVKIPYEKETVPSWNLGYDGVKLLVEGTFDMVFRI